MKSKLIFILAITSIMMGTGCTRTQYIDKPTPPGSVPPPPPSVSRPSEQALSRTTLPEGAYARENIQRYELGDNMTRDFSRPSPNSGQFVSKGTIARFSSAYKSKGQPKIAIFLNRTLSDEVREWLSPIRHTVSGEGSITKTRETARTLQEETIKGPLVESIQFQQEIGGQRRSIDERQLWPIEDGFMKPFLNAGTKLIDRATIMRLMALEHERKKSGEYTTVSAKSVEMNALVDKADIFIELLVARVPSAALGYEFKSSAKEVKTGRIIANATSLNWDKEYFEKKKIVTTDSGYETAKQTEMPEINEVSYALAIDMMHSLVQTWEYN